LTVFIEATLAVVYHMKISLGDLLSVYTTIISQVKAFKKTFKNASVYLLTG